MGNTYTPYEKTFDQVDWKNKKESATTPLNAMNLNKADTVIPKIEDELINLGIKKFDLTSAYDLVSNITYDKSTGNITVLFYDGKKANIELDVKLNRLAVNFSYDKDKQALVLELSDGTTEEVSLSDFITTYEFKDDVIIFSIDENGVVSATIKEGSITKDMVDFLPDLEKQLQDVTMQAKKSEEKSIESQEAAQEAQKAAQEATNMSDEASNFAELSKSWAVGGTGTRDDEDTDNAAYWAQQAKEERERLAIDVEVTAEYSEGNKIADINVGGKVTEIYMPKNQNVDAKMDKENPVGTGSIAVGENCTSSGANSQAFGFNAKASGEGAFASGTFNADIVDPNLHRIDGQIEISTLNLANIYYRSYHPSYDNTKVFTDIDVLRITNDDLYTVTDFQIQYMQKTVCLNTGLYAQGTPYNFGEYRPPSNENARAYIQFASYEDVIRYSGGAVVQEQAYLKPGDYIKQTFTSKSGVDKRIPFSELDLSHLPKLKDLQLSDEKIVINDEPLTRMEGNLQYTYSFNKTACHLNLDVSDQEVVISITPVIDISIENIGDDNVPLTDLITLEGLKDYSFTFNDTDVPPITYLAEFKINQIFAEGAEGNFSHAEGYHTYSKGNFSHAEGSSCIASGDSSHAEGSSCTAGSLDTHAEGSNSKANSPYTHAEGYYAIANKTCQFAHGSRYEGVVGAETDIHIGNVFSIDTDSTIKGIYSGTLVGDTTGVILDLPPGAYMVFIRSVTTSTNKVFGMVQRFIATPNSESVMGTVAASTTNAAATSNTGYALTLNTNGTWLLKCSNAAYTVDYNIIKVI